MYSSRFLRRRAYEREDQIQSNRLVRQKTPESATDGKLSNESKLQFNRVTAQRTAELEAVPEPEPKLKQNGKRVTIQQTPDSDAINARTRLALRKTPGPEAISTRTCLSERKSPDRELKLSQKRATIQQTIEQKVMPSGKRPSLEQMPDPEMKPIGKRVTIQKTPEPDLRPSRLRYMQQKTPEPETKPHGGRYSILRTFEADRNSYGRPQKTPEYEESKPMENTPEQERKSADRRLSIQSTSTTGSETKSANVRLSTPSTRETVSPYTQNSSANSDSLSHSLADFAHIVEALDDLPLDVDTVGKYVNWSTQHTALTAQPWCCIGDLMAFCDQYEYRTLSLTDAKAHGRIVAEVTALLTPGRSPFHMRKRFPGNIRNPENLWVCIGRCASVEYHLGRILNVFRRPLEKLTTDKQRAARQNFHLAVNELRLDISARISEVRLYDRLVFEREFQLQWVDFAE